MSVQLKRPEQAIKRAKGKATMRQGADQYSDLASLFTAANNKETVLANNHRFVSPYGPAGGGSLRPASGSQQRKLQNQSGFIVRATKTPRVGCFPAAPKEQSPPRPELAPQPASPPKRSQKISFKISPFNFKAGTSAFDSVKQSLLELKSGWHPGALAQSCEKAKASPATGSSKFTFRQQTQSEEPPCFEGHRAAAVSGAGPGYKIRWFDNSFCPVQQQLTFGSMLGEGGFAQVFGAFDLKLAQPVAVKVFDKRKLLDSSRRREVQNELEFLERIRHPRVVRLLRVVEDQSRVLFVLANWGSETLKDFAGRVGHGPELASVLQRLAEALAFLHGQGIFHRDVKLTNVMVRDGQPCLIDFGMACSASSWKEYLYCGTANYLSPEMVARSGYFGGPNDVWAFGVLLFRATAGVYPFGGKPGSPDSQKSAKELHANIAHGRFDLKRARKEFLPLFYRIFEVEPARRISMEKVGCF